MLKVLKLCLLLSVAASALLAQDATTATASSTPALTRSDVIFVTGTFEPAPLSESNRAVDSLPVRGETLLFGSMFDFLRQDASLDLQQRGAWGTQADLSIRGATFGQSL